MKMSLNLCQLEAPICAVGDKDHGFEPKEMQKKTKKWLWGLDISVQTVLSRILIISHVFLSSLFYHPSSLFSDKFSTQNTYSSRRDCIQIQYGYCKCKLEILLLLYHQSFMVMEWMRHAWNLQIMVSMVVQVKYSIRLKIREIFSVLNKKNFEPHYLLSEPCWTFCDHTNILFGPLWFVINIIVTIKCNTAVNAMRFSKGDIHMVK